jgi:3-oxoacyl-[acyl-carrier protein] reductase
MRGQQGNASAFTDGPILARLAEGRMDVLLEDKNAVIYGGGGSVGGAVARAFAREGARVFLAGRTLAPLEAVAAEISAAGGRAETSQVDALDERAVDQHADTVAEVAGSIDVSFNTIGHGDVHGMPVLEMPYEDFARPIAVAMRTQYLTARAAARHMVERGSGVILAITATTARLTVPNVGGTGVTFDAIESLCRQLARELGPRGVRVAWLRTTGLPEALDDSGELTPDYGAGRLTLDEHVAWMRRSTMLNRLTSLAEVGEAAAFLASDRAGGMTAAAANITCGAVPD